MPPPPAEPLASRIFLGPALRTQPDRRLVKLVREGYEAAFEEIVRRYRRPLDRFAAAIVGNRSEDVTQDAFSKALLALRGSDKEIELRPWLYRIVRNTALNDLRDSRTATEELGEAVAGGPSAAFEAERREEISELMERLRALPEPQRAAIVMRELEGLSHEEIAAALGVSGGAARQTIHRARVALRDGLGLLVPLPLLRMLFDHGAEAAAGASGVAAAGAASAAGGGATLGGLGAGGALKVGVATALLAGSLGGGVALRDGRDGDGPRPAAASAPQLPGAAGAPGSSGSPGGSGRGSELSSEQDHRDDGPGSRGDDRGAGGGERRGRDRGEEDSSEPGGSGPSLSGHSGSGGGSGDDRSDGTSGGSRSGGQSSGGEDGGHHDGGGGGDGDGDSHGGSGDGGSGSSDSGGSGSSGSGSGSGSGSTEIPLSTTEPLPDYVDDSHSGSGSSGSGSGSGDSGPGPADDDS